MESEQEIEKRKPVWAALADLYLDTEPSEDDYRYIAGKIKESGYSKDEILHIIAYEVHPILSCNLKIIAGQWGAWSNDFLENDFIPKAIMLFKRKKKYFLTEFCLGHNITLLGGMIKKDIPKIYVYL